MNSRTAQNALNFFLSKRFTITGDELLAAVEVVRELQVEVNNGGAQDSESGSPKTED